MGEREKCSAGDNAKHHGGATSDSVKALCDSAQQDTAKEPLFKDRRDHHGGDANHHKAAAVRRREQVVDGLIETLEVKGVVGQVHAANWHATPSRT